MAHQLETWVPDQMLDIALRAGKEIVDAHHLVPGGDEPVA